MAANLKFRKDQTPEKPVENSWADVPGSASAGKEQRWDFHDGNVILHHNGTSHRADCIMHY